MTRPESTVLRLAPAQALLALLLAVGGAGSPAVAADNRDACDCYGLTAWTVDSGLPSGTVLAIAQDRAGYLWIGTSEGLIRFDGHQFTEWEQTSPLALPGGSISALIAARDGSLWVGFSDARGVARIRASDAIDFYRDELPHRPITVLVEDQAGALWTGGAGGLSRFADGGWRTVGPADGFPESEVTSVYEDQSGRLWVGTSVGVLYREPGAATFTRHPSTARFISSFAEDADGHLWITDMARVVKRLDGERPPTFAPDIRLPLSGWRLRADRRGNLWVAALGGGLFRISHRTLTGTARVERVKYEHKFAGEGPGGARAIFEDRDHNIWVSMRAGGLLRIHETSVDSDIPLQGLTFDGVRALAATGDGSVWVATFYNLIRFHEGGRTVYDFPQTMALHAGADGELWTATGWGLGRFRHGQLVEESLPDGLRLERISSLARAPDGALWICSVEQGVFRWTANRLDQFDGEPVAGRPCGVVHAESNGQIWIGFTGGGLATYLHGRFREITVDDGLAPGAIAAIHEDDRRRIWIASVGGVSRFENGRLTTLTERNGLPRRLVPTLLQDQQGYMWLGVDSGAAVIRFDPQDFDEAAAGSDGQLRHIVYDETDGLIGTLFRSSRPSAVLAGDGKIWLASGNSLVRLHPAHVPEHLEAPRPTINRVVIDGHDADPVSGLVLPPHTATVRVDYSALDLVQASKLRFRHMLEGFDQRWVDAGQSRQALYMNLRPGDYRLRIDATSTGAWGDAETVWAFSVDPPFHQTRWFVAVCFVGSLMLISGVWLARVRTMRKEFALVVAERARVSRDLHDTLLQSLAAVGMELEVLATHFESGVTDSMSSALRALRRQVGRCVVEARRSTCELRSPRLEVRDLIEDLRQVADDVRLGSAVNVEVVVSGRRRRCAPEVEEQLLKIGQEAITNAVRHSTSNHVRVALTYSRSTASLAVSDTGRGFDPDTGQSGERWGIRNMRERATRISAQFRITSRPGAGTEVEITVPL